MSEEEIMEEVRSFTRDIKRWVLAKDYTSALVISRGLTKFLLDIKKQAKPTQSEEAITDETGIYTEVGMNPHDCRITVCYKGKCKTVYIADGYHDMMETAQIYLEKTMLELATQSEKDKE